jgi:hypothetical protein
VSASEPVVLRGQAHRTDAPPAAVTVTLGPVGFSVALGDAPPWDAAYRDVASVVADDGAVLVALGEGPDPERWVFERFGSGLGALARGLRDGRLRQWLGDGLVEIADDQPIELVEVGPGPMVGVAQLLYHDRGVVLAPLDERLPRLRIRRADIGAITATPERGRLSVVGTDGALAVGRTIGDASAGTPVEGVDLVGLGAAATSHQQRWSARRDAAAADIASIVGALVPDAPFEVRRLAASALREGRPVDAATLGGAWELLERAVLSEPTFAESYRALLAKAGAPTAPRWLAMAPASPGAADDPKVWFLLGLPGNLVALELVSAGAHATYLFRVGPRATYQPGAADAAGLAAAVSDVSEALLDSRFLREPMAIPAARLADAAYLRYRLAIAALPSLAAARRRFVARIVHRDPASWSAALDDLVAWHGAARDEAAEWPGRAAEEAQVEALGGSAGPAED